MKEPPGAETIQTCGKQRRPEPLSSIRSCSAIDIGGFLMRTYALAIAAAALFAFPTSTFSQNIEIGPGGVHIGGGGDRDGSRQQDCEELRRACEHKDELGEQGEGNCRRYRETCKD
jgi:hypothetical protein